VKELKRLMLYENYELYTVLERSAVLDAPAKLLRFIPTSL
jgi:hypothetical protein